MKIDCMRYLLILALLCFISFLPAQTPMKDPGAFKEQLAIAAKNSRSIESNFIQEKNLNVLSEKIRTRGKFYFRKENKLRWEYTDPFKYLFILNNGKVFIKDEDKQNKFDVRTNKMFNEINVILMGSVQGTLLNDEKRFSVSFFESPAGFIVKLKPRTTQLKTFLSEIVITFDRKDYSVIRLEMNEPSGDATVIDFVGKKINTLADDEKFIIP